VWPNLVVWCYFDLQFVSLLAVGMDFLHRAEVLLILATVFSTVLGTFGLVLDDLRYSELVSLLVSIQESTANCCSVRLSPDNWWKGEHLLDQEIVDRYSVDSNLLVPALDMVDGCNSVRCSLVDFGIGGDSYFADKEVRSCSWVCLSQQSDVKRFGRPTRDVPDFLPNFPDCDMTKPNEATHDMSCWEFRRVEIHHIEVLCRHKVSEVGVDNALDSENCHVLSSCPPWNLDRLRKTPDDEIVLQLGQSRAESSAGLPKSRDLIRNF
jgi:hypothetical protein